MKEFDIELLIDEILTGMNYEEKEEEGGGERE